ncbi:MAG: histidine kinase [Bacteroidota bacterium]
MKKQLHISLNIAYWLMYFSLLNILLVAGKVGQANPVEMDLVYQVTLGFIILPSVFSFYGSYLFAFPGYLRSRSVVKTGLVILLIVLLTILIGFSATSILASPTVLVKNGYLALFGQGLLIALIGVFNVICGFIIKGFIAWYQDLNLREPLKRKNTEIETSLIKSKLDLHFLFNTINNIDVLTITSPEVASIYLNKLSDILRFILYEVNTDRILLKHELDYIQKYISLQKIRTANQEFVEYNQVGNLDQQVVAPMLFLPLVENAFKHVSNKKLKNAIQIEFRMEEHQVELICKNRYSKKQRSNHKGIGNELITKRLELLYPDAYRLTTQMNEDQYVVHLTLQLCA